MAEPDIFNFDVISEAERQWLLKDSVERIDALQGMLGTGKTASGESAEKYEVQAASNSKAKFGDLPTIYQISEEYFTSQNQPVPYSFKQLSPTHDFYQIFIPIDLKPARNWSFNFLQVSIEFNPLAPKDGSRPKSYLILPDQKFQDIVTARGKIEIQLDGNFEFSARIPTMGGAIGPAAATFGAGAGAKLDAGAGLSIPAFAWSVQKATITHSRPGLEEVAWIIEDTDFFEARADGQRTLASQTDVSVIVQVPKGKRELKIAAKMSASRSFHLFSASLQDIVQELPAALREYFRKGLPIGDERSPDDPWDLSGKL